ncbi:unnamed protein product [Microthlaspi erraticum]|uniref:Uncharacterized protein n=1 Tax=Microthlaspi erraticum TaxID=1685480 RepID=A0A6D2I5V4_9BRAS|nr:unnamed protein product [Microthlaspi erraticum]
MTTSGSNISMGIVEIPVFAGVELRNGTEPRILSGSCVDFHGFEQSFQVCMLMSLYQKNWNADEAEFGWIVCESAYSAMITIYTRLRLYGKAEEVMKEDRVKLRLENWLVMLNALIVSKGRWIKLAFS